MRRSAAKITRPRTNRAILRPRLFQRLDRARREGAAVWVAGDPGAGKTTLVASWIERRKAPCVWLQVDEGDAALPSFFYYLGLAARSAERGKTRPLPALTPEYYGDLDTFVRGFFRELFSRLRSRTVVVLDNVQDVGADSAFPSVIQKAIEELPSRLCMVLVSRSEPQPALARLRANRALHVVPRRELKLTSREARSLARHWKVASRAQVDEIHELVHGWVAGLVLLLARAREALPTHPAPGQGAAATFDYFAGEILDRMDDAPRRALLEAGLLPAPTADLAAAATGSPDASRFLAGLARRGLFTVRHESGGGAFELHPLFQAFLRRRADEELTPERRAEVRRAAAAYLAGRDREGAEAAIELFAHAGAFAEMAPLIVQHAPAALAAGRWELVERWLARLPEPLREREPWLLYVAARARLVRDPAGARERFERAFAGFEARPEAPGVWLSWAGIVEATILQRIEFSGIGRWIDAYHALRERFGPPPAGEVEWAVAFAALTVLVFNRPDDATFRALAETGRKAALAPGDPRRRLVAGAYYVAHHGYWRGDLARARPVVEALQRVARAPDTDPLAAIVWLSAEAPFHFVAGQGAAGVAATKAGRRLSAEKGVHVWDFPLFVMAAQAALGVDDVPAARRLVEEMRPMARAGTRIDLGVHLGIEAIVALREGAAAETVRCGREALEILRQGGYAVHEIIGEIGVGRALHLIGDPRGAAEHLALGRQGAERIDSFYLIHLAALAQAEMRLKCDGRDAAVESLRLGLALAREHGVHSHLLFSPADVAPLYELALEEGIAVEHVRRTIRERGVPPPPGAGEAWPWPLRIRTLGGFEITRGGGPLPLSPRQRKPLELLQALVAFGGRDVDAEALAHALWPDAEGDAAQHALETALYRLRRIVGQDAIVQQGRRISFAADRCWVDAQNLDARLTAALVGIDRHGGLDPGGPPAEPAGVVGLYRGPFLGSDDAPWAAAVRDRLRRKLARWLAALPRDQAQVQGVRQRLVEADPGLWPAVASRHCA